MVRRARTAGGSLNAPPSGQKRLDEVLSDSLEARSEREYRELADRRHPSSEVPYEERLIAWFQERERVAAARQGAPPTEKRPAPAEAKP